VEAKFQTDGLPRANPAPIRRSASFATSATTNLNVSKTLKVPGGNL
jgi:hypothetical protein